MADQQQGGSFGGLPGSPNKIINFPENTGFVVFEVFETLNTKPPRPAIQDSEMSVCDGFMPFGPSNIRTLYGVGSTIYSTSSGLTLVAPWFYNFGQPTYAACLLSDGSVVQVNTNTQATTQIMSAGTIQNPNPNQTWMTQWNSKYLIIVSVQTNGYWLWDGTNLFGAGEISPESTITDAGNNYTSAPTITFQTTSATAVAPTFSATVMNGSVTAVNVVTPGSGFAVNDLVGISFSGGGSDDTAQATANISANTGPVTNIVVTGSVSNVPNTAYITLTGGGGTGATAALIANNGALESITVTNGGTGYSTPPTVVLNSATGVVGTFSAVAEVSYGEIPTATITNAGTGYTSPPVVSIVGDGTGALAQAITDAAGNVTSIVFSSTGYGYTKALVVFSGGNNAADATVILMPFGVQGTTVEVYENRVWIGNVRTGYFTAPSTVSDFSPADGAGAFQNNNSFQRVSFSSFKQTNGFLYELSDSSVDYIGGVQTSAVTNASGVAVTETVFNNLNVDPQIGSPWPASVQLFSRNIVLANSFGIFVSYGGAVTKISTPLDGIYNTVVTSGGTASGVYPSGAIGSLFGIAVYMLLLPIIDQTTGQQTNKLLIWDGKRWFTSSQDMPLTFIASQEINSILTVWGTDGTNLFSLFQQPSVGFQKTVQSKLWANPSYWFDKVNPYIAGILNFYNTGGTVNVAVDNQTGASEDVSITLVAGAIWTNASDVVVLWTNASSQVVPWGAPGLSLVPPQQVGQIGVLMGMTVTTNAADLSILSLALLETNYQYLGG